MHDADDLPRFCIEDHDERMLVLYEESPFAGNVGPSMPESVTGCDRLKARGQPIMETARRRGSEFPLTSIEDGDDIAERQRRDPVQVGLSFA